MDDLYVSEDVFEDQDEDMDAEESNDENEQSGPGEPVIEISEIDNLEDQDQMIPPSSPKVPTKEGVTPDGTNNETEQDSEPVKTGQFRFAYPLAPSEEMCKATSYDIVPTTLFMQGGPVHSVALSWGSQTLLVGGDDGYIRRYDFAASLGGKQLLAMGQRNAAVDTIIKAGVLLSYWENEQPKYREEYDISADGTYVPDLSPVYSLAVQSESLWLCAGLKSGGINLQTIRYGEGRTQAYLEGHKSTVSELCLHSEERTMISGSWDRTVVNWDLETGKQTNRYQVGGQVSALAWQPLGGAALVQSESRNGQHEDEDQKQDGDDDDAKSLESLFGSDEEEKEGNVESPKVQETNTANESSNVFVSASVTGVLELWDLRTSKRASVLGRTTAPPWSLSASWSTNGNEIFTGRRNASVDQYDIRTPTEPMRTLKFPSISGAVTCVSPLPNGRHLACASLDNIRLYDLQAQGRSVPFEIVPGHHGARISRLVLDPTSQFLIAASSGRGWEEASSEAVLAFEIAPLIN